MTRAVSALGCFPLIGPRPAHVSGLSQRQIALPRACCFQKITETGAASGHSVMAAIPTYTLQSYGVPDPDGGREVQFSRPFAITVGTQIHCSENARGKTLLRFSVGEPNPMLSQQPGLVLRVGRLPPTLHGAIMFHEVTHLACLELIFDNESLHSEHKQMPGWLVEALEFAADTLKRQEELNRRSPFTEDVD